MANNYMTYSSKMNQFKGIIDTYNHVSVTSHAGTTTQVAEASTCQQQSYSEPHSPGQSSFYLLIIRLKTGGPTGRLSAASRSLKWLSYLLGTLSCEELFVITFLV